MGTRSVRLDLETEQALASLVEKTGASLSTILKRGILGLRDQELGASTQSAYEAYCKLDLGPGGYAVSPARKSREGVREAILLCTCRTDACGQHGFAVWEVR